MEITYQVERTSSSVGNCAARGCSDACRYVVRATVHSTQAVTFACQRHVQAQEIHALRMLADALDHQRLEHV